MAGLHIKGYVLALLAGQGPLWDHEVADAVGREFGATGPYWEGTVRLTLTDLYSGGLIDELDATVDPARSRGVEKVLFRYGVNDFGRERMAQSGLLGVQP